MNEPLVSWSIAQEKKTKSSPIKFKRPATSAAKDYQVPSSYIAPRSLSISDMLKLGQVNTQTATVVIKVYEFDMDLLSWVKVPKTVEFCEEKTAVGRGGFRTAYKASSKHPDFKGTSWVVKHYLPEALKCIEETEQTTEEHSKKVVQMHLLARNISLQLEQAVRKTENQDFFGEVPKYKKIFHGVTEAGEHVTIEEYIKGAFVKYINNNGTISQAITGEDIEKMECLTHFSYVTSDKKLMLLDLQGSGHELYDTEIASTDLKDDDHKFMYCTENLSKLAINTFVNAHKCNVFCRLLGLEPLVD